MQTEQQSQENSGDSNNKHFLAFSSKRKSFFKRAMLYDKISRNVIFAGGYVTIIAVIGILVFVFYEAFPLWEPAEGKDNKRLVSVKQPKIIGLDEYNTLLYTITDSAAVDILSLENKKIIETLSIDSIAGETVTAASRSLANNFIGCGTSNGKAAVFKIEFNITFDDKQNRITKTTIEDQQSFVLDSSGRAITKLEYRNNGEAKQAIVSLVADSAIVALVAEKSGSLIDEGELTVHQTDITSLVDGKVTSMELDDFCEKLMIGTQSGSLYYISLLEPDNPVVIQKIDNPIAHGAAITALSFVLGDQSVIAGDSKGNVFSLMRILDDETDYGWQIVLSHKFKPQEAAITGITGSTRNKSFITGDAKGNIVVRHLTSERVLLELQGEQSEARNLVFSPKNDGAAVLFANGTIVSYSMDIPHPEITTQTVFGKVWYEGYKSPEYVWQSTGGSDDFEPKFSLIPLILGTLKGTLYALLFAIPIALLGAVYTSLFAHPKIKNIIKPVVEIMAALPSVVIGFLAGLWLAPILEKELPAVFLMFFTMPVLILIGAIIWMQIPKITGKYIATGWEVLLIVPLLLIGGFVALQLGPVFEQTFLKGDFTTWLKNTFAQQYDQRNAIVVGFAMGFAVIPIIFTICEDSLSSVPDHLKSSSLALGATRWQTAVRIVVPTASPGIFSGIMVGFGRAIGETMIVLMATGNTPILDFSLFNGMRTMSANIAVEIPEAPMGGTLYRVLFLSAALLFVMTFVVNTAAELVRQRLRKKYMHI